MKTSAEFKADCVPVSLPAMLAAARAHIGAKWRHHGRKQWAIDCLGLLIVSFRAGGVYMHNATNYRKEPWNDGLEEYLYEHFGAPLDVSDRQVGDVVLIHDEQQPAPAHLGIVGDGDTLIHSYSETGVIEHSFDDVWLRRAVCVYRPNWGGV